MNQEKQYPEITSLTGKHPFQFQYETLEFLKNSGFRAGIFHEMGLGKTICSLIAIKENKEELLPCIVFCKSSLKLQWLKEIIEWTSLPAQVIEKGSDKPYPSIFKIFIVSLDLAKNLDWIKTINPKLAIIDECQAIKNSSSKRTQAIKNILSGREPKPRRIHKNIESLKRQSMIAHDLMNYHGLNGRFELGFEDKLPISNALAVCECESKKEDEGIITGRITIQRLHAGIAPDEVFIDTILHEIAHAITPGAGHRPIWKETCKNIGGSGEEYSDWCMGTVNYIPTKDEFIIPHVFALSGTPIKNHAGEYYPILNILFPDLFPSESHFLREFCDQYNSGWRSKIGGFSRYGAERFRELTKDKIIRFTREEKLPDLPKVFRKGLYLPLGPEVKAMYENAFRDFQDEMLNPGEKNFGEAGNILAKMNRLRHITGLAKILPVTEFAIDLLENTEKEKIVIFVHHKDVGEGIYSQLNNYCLGKGIFQPLQLTSANAGNDIGYRIDDDFRSNPNARILIASTLSAGEGKNWQFCSNMIMTEYQWNPANNREQPEARFSRPGATIESVSATYSIAIGTIDEAMIDINAQKDEYLKKTLDGIETEWTQDSFVQNVAQKLMTMGMKKWMI